MAPYYLVGFKTNPPSDGYWSQPGKMANNKTQYTYAEKKSVSKALVVVLSNTYVVSFFPVN